MGLDQEGHSCRDGPVTIWHGKRVGPAVTGPCPASSPPCRLWFEKAWTPWLQMLTSSWQQVRPWQMPAGWNQKKWRWQPQSY